MNKELKHLLLIAFGLLLVLIFSFNLCYYLRSNNFISQATKTSQIINKNRLRSPNTKRSSERWSYPKVTKSSQLKLVAVKKQRLLWVVNTRNNHIIYTIHAQINIPVQKKPLKTLYARGQQIYHVNGSKQATGNNWLGISNGYYIETPVSDFTGQHVSHNLFKSPVIQNTIQVSKPDAKWLQKLPENTPLIIKEGD